MSDATPETYPGPYTMQKTEHGICPSCGRAAFLPHECPPWHTVRYGNQAATIRAISPEEAAELWAADFDERTGGRKPYIVSTGPVRVTVTDAAGRETRWDVRGEIETRYRAFEVQK